jgi:TonB family protein
MPPADACLCSPTNDIVRLLKSALFVSCLLLFLVSSPAQPKPEEPIYKLMDKGVKPPLAIFTPAPDVPREERKVKSTSVAIVAGYVGADGLFHDAKVQRSSGDSTLDARALDRIRTWTFHPCTKDGKPVNCELYVEVTFRLYRDGK